MTYDDLHGKFLAYRRKHDAKTTAALMLKVANVESLDDVPPEKYEQLVEAFESTEEETKEDPAKNPRTIADLNHAEIYDRWNSAKKFEGGT